MPAEQFIFAAVAEVVETLQSVGRQGERVAQQYASHHHAGRRRKQGVAVLHRLPYPFGRRETVQARVVLCVEVEGQTFIYEIRGAIHSPGVHACVHTAEQPFVEGALQSVGKQVRGVAKFVGIVAAGDYEDRLVLHFQVREGLSSRIREEVAYVFAVIQPEGEKRH